MMMMYAVFLLGLVTTCFGQPLVVVFGSTGHVGSLAAEALVGDERFQVRLLYHSRPSPLCSNPGVTCLHVELTDPSSVEAAVADADRILFMTGVHMDVVEHTHNFVNAVRARAKSVSQIVYVSECEQPSKLLLHAQFSRETKKQIHLMETSGLPVVRLEPGVFTQDPVLYWGLLEQLPSMHYHVTLPDDDPLISWSDIRDVAASAVALLSRPVSERSHYVIVSDVAPFSHLFAAFQRRIPGLQLHITPRQQWQQQLEAAGMPQWISNDFPWMLANLHLFATGCDSGDGLTELLEREPYTVEETVQSLEPQLFESLQQKEKELIL